MPCYHPQKGYHANPDRNDGKRGFTKNKVVGYTDRPLTIPCGGCVGCRLDRARDWSIRCLHESKMHPINSYLTLTYAPEHLPSPPSVSPRVLSLFVKRLRQQLNIPGLRFYACGEYGEKLSRPHYHLLLFGYDFPDKRFWKKTKRGDTLYTSKALDKIWGFGHCNLGAVTQASAGYVARYILKKQTGDIARDHYVWYDAAGHPHKLHDEFNQMSRGSKKLNTGGIGQSWYDRYGDTDCHDTDCVIGANGREYPVPAYYDKLLGKKDPQRLAKLKRLRAERAETTALDNTSRRLHDREIIQKSKLTMLKRDYEK